MKPAKLERKWSNPLLAVVRLLALTIFSISIYLLHLLRQIPLREQKRRFEVASSWAQVWGRGCCRLAGIRVEWEGPRPPKGSLLCPNHLGYVDVLALLSAVPVFFVTRADAGSWPLIGAFIRSSEQVLVSRRRSRDLMATARQVEERLRLNQYVCVFLEGTSTGGDRLLPFHASLLGPAIRAGVPVTPVALKWQPADPRMSLAGDVAYWGEHVFFPHLWRFAGLSGAHCRIIFGPPVPSAGVDRKTLANRLRREVLRMLGMRDEAANGAEKWPE